MAEKTKNGTWHELSQHQLATVTELIRARVGGVYTAKELHGEQWERVRPRRYGALFKQAVLDGVLPGIRLVGRKSNKSLLYQVL